MLAPRERILAKRAIETPEQISAEALEAEERLFLEAKEKASRSWGAGGCGVIYVHPFGPKAFALEVRPSDTLVELKAKIHDHAGISVDQQRLILNGKMLEHDRTLADYAIGMGSKLQLTINLRGGMLQETSGQVDYTKLMELKTKLTVCYEPVVGKI